MATITVFRRSSKRYDNHTKYTVALVSKHCMFFFSSPNIPPCIPPAFSTRFDGTWMSAATAEAGKYPADVWQNIPRQPRAGRRAVSAQNVMSVRILVNKKRYCWGTQVVNGRVAQIPGECEEMPLFLVLLNTKILVKPINIQAKTLCSAGSFFKGLESYKCSAFPLFQPFRQWEFWLERIPGPLPDMAQIFCGLQGHPRKREWSVSWALRAATQASAGCQSSQGQGMEQNESKRFVCLVHRHF